MNNKSVWPVFSAITIYAVFSLILFVCLEIYISDITTYIAFIFNIVILPAVGLFFELNGLKERLFNFWSSCPQIIHKGIVLIYTSLIVGLIYQYLPQIVVKKREYAK